MIIGEEQPDTGSIKVGDTVRIAYVDQNRARIDPDKNVWEDISDGESYIKAGKSEIPSRAYVAAFGFKGGDQQKLAGVMSGGERNRVNLALTLKQGGNLLLLDEPTNDLDVETLSSLENALLEFPGCAVITSHDRWFLDRDRHPHPGLGRRVELVLVRRQLRVVREEQDRAARCRGGQAAPGHLPQLTRAPGGGVEEQLAPAGAQEQLAPAGAQEQVRGGKLPSRARVVVVGGGVIGARSPITWPSSAGRTSSCSSGTGSRPVPRGTRQA